MYRKKTRQTDQQPRDRHQRTSGTDADVRRNWNYFRYSHKPRSRRRSGRSTRKRTLTFEPKKTPPFNVRKTRQNQHSRQHSAPTFLKQNSEPSYYPMSTPEHFRTPDVNIFERHVQPIYGFEGKRRESDDYLAKRDTAYGGTSLPSEPNVMVKVSTPPNRTVNSYNSKANSNHLLSAKSMHYDGVSPSVSPISPNQSITTELSGQSMSGVSSLSSHNHRDNQRETSKHNKSKKGRRRTYFSDSVLDQDGDDDIDERFGWLDSNQFSEIFGLEISEFRQYSEDGIYE